MKQLHTTTSYTYHRAAAHAWAGTGSELYETKTGPPKDLTACVEDQRTASPALSENIVAPCSSINAGGARVYTRIMRDTPDDVYRDGWAVVPAMQGMDGLANGGNQYIETRSLEAKPPVGTNRRSYRLCQCSGIETMIHRWLRYSRQTDKQTNLR